MKKSYLLFLALLALNSCKDDQEQPFSSMTEKTEDDCFNIKALYSTNHTISRKQAEEIALNFVNGATKNGDGGNTLKSTNSLKVSSTIVRSGAKGIKTSKGVKQDTLGYFVNFADNNGYAYVCADDRVDAGVLALFDKGNFEGENDTLISPVYDKIDKYVSSSINEFEEKREQRIFRVEEAIKNGELDTCTSKNQTKAFSIPIDYVYGPFVKATLGQKYNDYLPYCKCDYCTKNNKKNKVVAGCLVVALAQYQAYWGDLYSSYINDWIDFSKVNRDPTPQEFMLGRTWVTETPKCQAVSYFYNQISEAGGIVETTHFHTSAKSSSIGNVKGFLKGQIRETPHALNTEKVITWLSKYKSPVFIEGKGVLTYNHIWLCDGVLAKYKFYPLAPRLEKKFCYLHYNWGWDGANNGFFLDDIFVNTGNGEWNDFGYECENSQYEDLQMWGMAPYDYETKKPRYPYSDYWVHGMEIVFEDGSIIIP